VYTRYATSNWTREVKCTCRLNKKANKTKGIPGGEGVYIYGLLSIYLSIYKINPFS